MTNEEFTDITVNNLDPPGTRISRSSKFSVVNSTEIALNIPHKTPQNAYFMRFVRYMLKRIFCESDDYRQDNSLC